jgi:hypothetical protein
MPTAKHQIALSGPFLDDRSVEDWLLDVNQISRILSERREAVNVP